MKLGQGYWIQTDADTSLSYTKSTQTLSSIELKEGWNLINSCIEIDATNILTEYPNVIKAAGGGVGGGGDFRYDREFAKYAKGITKVSQGYWFKVDQPFVIECTSTPPVDINKTIIHNGVTYKTVISPYTKKVWLDRNLGASEVCSSVTDSACYGDYYQWGRLSDGHEKATSSISTSQALSITDAGDSFIDASDYDSVKWDWAHNIDSNGTLRSINWAKTDGSSICPIGFRVPTISELKAETIDINATKNVAVAFNSFLKLPAAGERSSDNGLFSLGYSVELWSNTIVPTTSSKNLIISSLQAGEVDRGRQMGLAVRCIEDNTTVTPTQPSIVKSYTGTLPTTGVPTQMSGQSVTINVLSNGTLKGVMGSYIITGTIDKDGNIVSQTSDASGTVIANCTGTVDSNGVVTINAVPVVGTPFSYVINNPASTAADTFFDGMNFYGFWGYGDELGSFRMYLSSGELQLSMYMLDKATGDLREQSIPSDDEYILSGSTWKSNFEMTYTISTDTKTLDFIDGTKVKISKAIDLSNSTHKFSEYFDAETSPYLNLEVTFSNDAKLYQLASMDAQEYVVDYTPKLHVEDKTTGEWIETNTTFSDIATYMQSVNGLGNMVEFERDLSSEVIGQLYESYSVIDSSGVAVTSITAGQTGNLVAVDTSTGWPFTQSVVGTWKVQALPDGQLGVLATPSVGYEGYFNNSENSKILIAVVNSKVMVGEYTPAFSEFKTQTELYLNAQAYSDIIKVIKEYIQGSLKPSVAKMSVKDVVTNDMFAYEAMANVKNSSEVVVLYINNNNDHYGFSVVDFSNSNEMKVVGNFDVNNSSNSSFHDIAVLGDVVYLVNELDGVPTLTLVSIKDPKNPKQISKISLADYGDHGWRVVISEDEKQMAVLTYFGKLNLYDVTNPASPTFVEKLSDKVKDGFSGSDGELIFSKDSKYLFLSQDDRDTHSSLYAFDVLNKSYLGTKKLPNTVGSIAVDTANHLYLGSNDFSYSNSVYTFSVKNGSFSMSNDYIVSSWGSKSTYIALGKDNKVYSRSGSSSSFIEVFDRVSNRLEDRLVYPVSPNVSNDMILSSDDSYLLLSVYSKIVLIELPVNSFDYNSFFNGTKYFVNEYGTTGYRTYDGKGGYTGSVGGVDVAGTYSMANGVMHLHRTKPSDGISELVFGYHSKSLMGSGTIFSLSIDGKAPFTTYNFLNQTSRDSFKNLLQATKNIMSDTKLNSKKFLLITQPKSSSSSGYTKVMSAYFSTLEHALVKIESHGMVRKLYNYDIFDTKLFLSNFDENVTATAIDLNSSGASYAFETLNQNAKEGYIHLFGISFEDQVRAAEFTYMFHWNLNGGYDINTSTLIGKSISIHTGTYRDYITINSTSELEYHNGYSGDLIFKANYVVDSKNIIKITSYVEGSYDKSSVPSLIGLVFYQEPSLPSGFGLFKIYDLYRSPEMSPEHYDASLPDGRN